MTLAEFAREREDVVAKWTIASEVKARFATIGSRSMTFVECHVLLGLNGTMSNDCDGDVVGRA